jgi:hypothetical protein
MTRRLCSKTHRHVTCVTTSAQKPDRSQENEFKSRQRPAIRAKTQEKAGKTAWILAIPQV